MIQPKLYYRNNALQKTDAKYVLDNYFHLIRFDEESEEAVLDVGCGIGDVTCELLRPRLPKSVKTLVGVDYSEDMIDFARSKWTNDVVFSRLNIAAEDVSVDYEENFDHVLSFYCLHWIMQQRRAVNNLYKVLRPGGDMLLTFLASNPIFTIYERMSRCNKWGMYMQDVKRYISPYHHSRDPVRDFETHLEEAGFEKHVCKIVHRRFTFSSFTVLKQSVKAVCPFLARMPDHLKDDYLSDYVKEVRNVEDVCIETANNNDETIHCQYKLFIVYASKS